MICRTVYGDTFEMGAFLTDLASQQRTVKARYDLTREDDTAVLTATLLLEPPLELWTARYDIVSQ